MFMLRGKKLIITIAAVVPLLIATGLEIRKRVGVTTLSTIVGAIIVASDDLERQRPISNAQVTVESEAAAASAVTETSGLFQLRLEPAVVAGQTIRVKATHPDYQPFSIDIPAEEQIYVVRLTPKSAGRPIEAGEQRESRLSNIRVRYATRATTTSTVGAAVRTFAVPNRANVPCDRRGPCSPDRKWKASVESLTLDAGEQKQFRNVRVSCIAGPCPFTAIESDRFSKGGRVVTVAVRNWSDTVTYLLEAEVAQTMDSETVRYTYPGIFGRSMNFSLPPDANGLSIEGDLDGSSIVFPLGPELRLSWATCRSEIGIDGTRQIRCELKPGYRFDSNAEHR